jgi:hypothetical protein
MQACPRCEDRGLPQDQGGEETLAAMDRGFLSISLAEGSLAWSKRRTPDLACQWLGLTSGTQDAAAGAERASRSDCSHAALAIVSYEQKIPGTGQFYSSLSFQKETCHDEDGLPPGSGG